MKKTIDLDENIMKRNKISVLIEDKEWLNNFGKYMTKAMEKIAKDLVLKVKEETEATKEIRGYKKQKKTLMEKILQLSDEVNNNENQEALTKLEEVKNQILRANDQIDAFQFKLETLPKEIENLNKELLTETIKIVYKDIKEGNGRIEQLTEEISKLREQLKNNWDEKIDLEDRVEILYAYLHNTLGYEETNKLDEKFL
ncbi:hypothetical protein [Marinisporobacter balticus]|uniref:Uncharacterized protein n=1 Tax=Marinisporobacter balticus TaxID=2018667 RepID=A0A4V2SAW3_9FIRM|nr:hypothetical protein [Marinisporobacter balticus]TCO73160.1 hypothetical protein EV214_11662 [Marinisporobacter balticus]